MKNYFLTRLDYATRDIDLQDWLAKHGVEVSSCKVITNRETGESRGFGFVTTDNPAILKLDGKYLGGRAIRIELARDPEPRPAQPRRAAGGRQW